MNQLYVDSCLRLRYVYIKKNTNIAVVVQTSCFKNEGFEGVEVLGSGQVTIHSLAVSPSILPCEGYLTQVVAAV